jgi:hypothetical protein
MKKLFSIIFALMIGLGGLIAVSTPAYADDAFDAVCRDEEVSADYKKQLGCPSAGGDRKDSFSPVLQYIAGTVIAISGSVALVFIIIGGIHYMTANGDPGKLKKAKETILYASIGLVIAGLAFAIVNWVIGLLPK